MSTISRREVLLSLPGAALALTASGTPSAFAQAPAGQPPGPFTLPPLPYPADALEPHIDAQTMTLHHDRHHAAYVTNLNAALAPHPELGARSLEDLVTSIDRLPEAVRAAVRNQGGGHLNHTLFWTSLKKGGGAPPTAEFARAIDAAFGDFTRCREALTSAAMGVFGSGWAWLSLDRAAKVIVETTPNQDCPLTRGHSPLLGIDVWEHAYYLKYQNRRRDYVDAIFNVIDWEAVHERWRRARA
jgi:Fe-Mn family superoxide dismutase